MPQTNPYISLIQQSFGKGEQNPANIMGYLFQKLWEKGQETHVRYPHSFLANTLANKIAAGRLAITDVFAEINRYQQESGHFGIKQDQELAEILQAFLMFYPHYDNQEYLSADVLDALPARTSLLFNYIHFAVSDTEKTLQPKESTLLASLVPHLSPKDFVAIKANVVQLITGKTFELSSNLVEDFQKIDQEAKKILTEPNEDLAKTLAQIKDASPLTAELKTEFYRRLRQPNHFPFVVQQREVEDCLTKLSEFECEDAAGEGVSAANYLEEQENTLNTLRKLYGEFKSHVPGDSYLAVFANSSLKMRCTTALLPLVCDVEGIKKLRASSPADFIKVAAEDIQDSIPNSPDYSRFLQCLAEKSPNNLKRDNVERVHYKILALLAPYIATERRDMVLKTLFIKIFQTKSPDIFSDICHAIDALSPLRTSDIPPSFVEKFTDRSEILFTYKTFKKFISVYDLDQQVFYMYGVIGRKLNGPDPLMEAQKLGLQIVFTDCFTAMHKQRSMLQEKTAAVMGAQDCILPACYETTGTSILGVFRC